MAHGLRGRLPDRCEKLRDTAAEQVLGAVAQAPADGDAGNACGAAACSHAGDRLAVHGLAVRPPLAREACVGSLEEAVRREIDLLTPIRERADFIVNSSTLTLGQLQSKLFGLFSPEGTKRQLEVTVESFGFKHGMPLDADLVFDVRFLPNPYYLEELRSMSGLDRPVAQYVFNSIQSRTFMEKVTDLLDFLVPLYVEEGKLGLTVAVGCTGGRHRSVAIAAALTEYLRAKGISAVNVNRDIDK